jgi:PAS domain S-box-containing protein
MSVSRLDDRRIVEVNEAYLTLFGVSAEATIGRTPMDAGIHPPAGMRDRVFRQLAEGEAVCGLELVFETPAGNKAIVLSSRAIEVDRTRFALSTFVDVTEQRRAVEDARVSDERFRQLAESVHEVFWLTDPDNTTMLYVSPAYEKIFGRPCAALYADARDWLLALHPDDRERMSKASHELGSGPQEHSYRVVVGGKVRSIHNATFPVRDTDGKVIRIAGITEDRTEQLHLEEQVRQTQKLESLGLLAGGVAHDFNNVLAVIGSNASLLAELIQPDHPDRELIDEIEAAVNRASSLTRQLLAFSRKEVIEPVVLDVNGAIAETRKMLRRMLGEDIVIETSLDPELHRTRIDPGYFVQILMNLAVNARDAMPRGGRLAITTRNSDREVRIEVADTGTGMAPDVRTRVFEPFFTTKGVGKGTGLGLSVVHGIVQQAGGQITIESELGAGTVICISLPAVDAPAERISDVVLAAQHGTEKIVLVDDDVFVRRATSRSLRSRGYIVLEAADAGAALRLLNDHGSDVALLVTDVVMPGTDGRELVLTARRHRPTLEVLYMSGYTDDAMLRHGLEHDQIPFIEKPFRSHALAGKVRHLLDTKAKRVAISR